AKECYSMKLDLLTNATVVDDAIRFVSDRSKDKEKLRPSSNSDENENESNEPDYNEDKDQLEEEQEGEAGEIAITTNAVF
ncbi:MAG: hypothetical protein ACJ71C_10255, partial [Nitrososphaeraceae archaeon]